MRMWLGAVAWCLCANALAQAPELRRDDILIVFCERLPKFVPTGKVRTLSQHSHVLSLDEQGWPTGEVSRENGEAWNTFVYTEKPWTCVRTFDPDGHLTETHRFSLERDKRAIIERIDHKRGNWQAINDGELVPRPVLVVHRFDTQWRLASTTTYSETKKPIEHFTYTRSDDGRIKTKTKHYGRNSKVVSTYARKDGRVEKIEERNHNAFGIWSGGRKDRGRVHVFAHHDVDMQGNWLNRTSKSAMHFTDGSHDAWTSDIPDERAITYHPEPATH